MSNQRDANLKDNLRDEKDELQYKADFKRVVKILQRVIIENQKDDSSFIDCIARYLLETPLKDILETETLQEEAIRLEEENASN